MPTGDANVNGFLAGRNIGEAQPLRAVYLRSCREFAEGLTLIQQPCSRSAEGSARGRDSSVARTQTRPRVSAGPGRLPAAIAEDAQQHQEEIDEIEIQLERADDGERSDPAVRQ